MMEKGFRNLTPINNKFDRINPIIQLFIALSLACYAVSMGILLSIAVLAIDDTNMDEVWLLVLVIMFLCAGVFLFLAILIVIVKESKPVIRSVILLLIPILILATGGLSFYLKNNFFGFKDYYGLAAYYGSPFTDRMEKVTTGLLWISLLTIAEITILSLSKIFTKQFKGKILLIIVSALCLLGILPIQITGLSLSKIADYHTIGLKLFFSGVICLSVLSLVAHSLVIKEINQITSHSFQEKIIVTDFDSEDDVKPNIDQQILNSTWDKSSISTIIFGVITLIAGIIWLMITATNQRLVYYQLHTIPESAFPEFTLSGIGSVIMAYGLFQNQKNMNNHRAKLITASILVALIIPTKVLAIFVVWFIGNKNPVNMPFGWSTSLKGFFIVITDLLPLILAQFLINYSTKQSTGKQWTFIWSLTSSIILTISATVYMLVMIWPKIIGEFIDVSIWLSVYRTTSIISIIALTNLIVVNLFCLIKKD